MTILGLESRVSATQSPAAVGDETSLMAPDARVRGVGPKLIAVINEAIARSVTFRGLVDRISSTDGIVYVSEGQCKHGVRACLSNTRSPAPIECSESSSTRGKQI